MFRRASEMYISSTIASRSISAAEDLPGNFFVSKNRYFMVNHQYFGGVEKKFVIHRASPRDMRTKRELGARRRGRECRNHRRRLAIFFPQTFTSCKFIIGSSSDWNKKICHERKKTRGGGVFWDIHADHAYDQLQSFPKGAKTEMRGYDNRSLRLVRSRISDDIHLDRRRWSKIADLVTGRYKDVRNRTARIITRNQAQSNTP